MLFSKNLSAEIKYLMLIFLLFPLSLFSATNPQFRSMTITQNGIVAAESPLAAEAGVMILQSGGNAIDAAIAANAVMGVVAPMSGGIGGDLFAIVYEAKTKKLYGLNASGWAPAGLSLSHFKMLKQIPENGINSVTIPGAVAGWQQLLTRFGRLSWPMVLGPAIRLAKEGVPIGEKVARDWAANAFVLQNPEAKQTFLLQQKPPVIGQLFRNPNLAWSYEQIAQWGAKAFYQGEITQKILQLSHSLGGTFTARDFADYRPEWVKPLQIHYHGWRIYELPPNSQGIAALMMLKIMQHFPLSHYGFGSPETLHIMIEAKKLAYIDLLTYIGDPKNQSLPSPKLLSDAYIAQRIKQINFDKANCQVNPGEIKNYSNTTYLSVVDRDGNMVSLIQSNYSLFGSGLVAPHTGFILQNRGALFNLDPRSPNVIAPHKRPLHTIIPGFMQNDSNLIAFGIMGGWNQAQAHAQFVSNIVDFGMNIQQALDAPRFTKLDFSGCDLEIENRFSMLTLKKLSMKGHRLHLQSDFARPMGAGQAVLHHTQTGVNYGASDPRKDGEAIPEVFLH